MRLIEKNLLREAYVSVLRYVEGAWLSLLHAATDLLIEVEEANNEQDYEDGEEVPKP